MDIYKRLIKEFWVPALAATTWTIYSLATRNDAWDIKVAVNVFGPSFFLLSWATGQFFRVKKQTHVDANLKGIEARLEGLVTSIEEKTADLLSHITGGESFCYFQFGYLNADVNQRQIVAIHQGDHPLHEVSARIFDINRFRMLEKIGKPNAFEACNTHLIIGNITPGHAAMLQSINLGIEDTFSANVFFTARNGDFTQLIRMKKCDGQWFSATRVKRGDRLLFEKVQEGFPGGAGGGQRLGCRDPTKPTSRPRGHPKLVLRYAQVQLPRALGSRLCRPSLASTKPAQSKKALPLEGRSPGPYSSRLLPW